MRVMFPVRTMSAASPHSNIRVPVIRGKSILLCASVGLLTDTGNSAAVVHSWADPHSTLFFCILLLTVDQVCACEPDDPTTATVVMP